MRIGFAPLVSATSRILRTAGGVIKSASRRAKHRASAIRLLRGHARPTSASPLPKETTSKTGHISARLQLKTKKQTGSGHMLVSTSVVEVSYHEFIQMPVTTCCPISVLQGEGSGSNMGFHIFASAHCSLVPRHVPNYSHHFTRRAVTHIGTKGTHTQQPSSGPHLLIVYRYICTGCYGPPCNFLIQTVLPHPTKKSIPLSVLLSLTCPP
jgi:hypothetical protein